MAERMDMRLDEPTKQRLAALSRELGIPRTHVIRQAVADLARQRGIRVPADQVPNGVPDAD